MVRGRRKIDVQVSPEALEGWRLFCAAQRVTMAGLIEAIGIGLHEVDVPQRELRRWVEAAALVDVERRQR